MTPAAPITLPAGMAETMMEALDAITQTPSIVDDVDEYVATSYQLAMGTSALLFALQRGEDERATALHAALQTSLDKGGEES